MKAFHKIISLVIALNILFSTVGLSRNAHYCGDKLSSLTYFTKASCCCGDTDDEGTDNCCKNERTVIQYKGDYVISQNTSPIKPEITASIFLINSFIFDNLGYTGVYFNHTGYQSKSNYHSPPLYLKNRAFII